jgi:type II secretory pathway component PulK
MALPITALHRRSERGLSMVLAMLVLFVVLVVVFQTMDLSMSELDQASHYVASTQMRYLADACAAQAGSVLLMDIEEREDEEDGGGGPGAGLGDGGLSSLGGGEGGGDDGEESAAQVTMNTDSFLDEWMNPGALAPPMGEGLTVYVEIVDEDSKINLLGLWTEDEDKREEWREVFTRLLDTAFEGTSLEVSAIDASDIIDELDDWVKGNRRRFRKAPLPPLKTSRAEDEADEDSQLDTDIIENEEVHFPLTVPELMMIEGITREHVWGFVEDDVHYSGLVDYVTIWSELELKDPPKEEDGEFADSPFAGSVFDEDLNEDEVEAPEDLEIEAVPTAGGRINANTASMAVLRALAPEEIPTAFLERIIEFRERIHELREEFDDNLGSLGADGAASTFGSTTEGQQDPDEEDDPAHYVFEAESEVFSKVEAEWELSVFSDDEQKSLFIERLGVISNVFTIKVLIQHPETGRRANYRTIVWRMESDGEDPRIITLLPLEEFADTRRIVDYPEELSELTDRRFDQPDGSRYELN